MRWWLVALALASGCRCKKEAGGACKYGFDCESTICWEGTCQSGLTGSKCKFGFECTTPGDDCRANTCTPPSAKGGSCVRGDHCATGLWCVDQTCLDEAQVVARGAAKDAASRKAKADEETRMLAESGVGTAAPTAETAAHPPGPGARVRTVKVTANTSAFAACKPVERLIGGGCQSTYAVKGSFPSGTSAEDTVGARWNCTEGTGAVTAYALCAKLTP